MSQLPVSKLYGNVYIANNGATGYGTGQIWCDNDIIIQDSATGDTRNIKTLGSNLNIVGNNVTINPTGTSAGLLNMTSYGASSWNNSGGAFQIENDTSHTMTIGNTNNNAVFTSNSSTLTSSATASVLANYININNNTVGSTINIGTDSNSGTTSIGASLTSKVLNVYGNGVGITSTNGISLINSGGIVTIANYAGNLNVGNDANTGVVNIGSVWKTVNLTGVINATGATSLNVATTGAITLNAAAASQTLSLGTDSNAGTVVIGNAAKTLTVNAGTTTIAGNLVVSGTTETLNATTTTFNDNVITLHALPAGTADSCVLFQRYGNDVQNESGATYYVLTVTSGTSGQNTLTCSAIGSATSTSQLLGCFIVNGGTNYLYVTAASGSGPYTLTLSANIGTTISAGSLNAYNRSSVGLLYTETSGSKGVNLGYYSAIAEQTGAFATTSFVGYADLRCGNVYASGTINGQVEGFYSQTASINSTNTTPVTLTVGATTGSFMVIVSPAVTGNATATFMISKSVASQTNGNIFRLTSAIGSLGTGSQEELNMQWGNGVLPQLYHSTAGSQTGNPVIVYNVRLVAY